MGKQNRISNWQNRIDLLGAIPFAAFPLPWMDNT
jgi:hypothetical protein